MRKSLVHRLFRIFPIIVCISVPHSHYGQEVIRSIDSLLSVLPQQKSDSQLVKLLNIVSLKFYTVNPDSGLIIGEKSKELAQKINWQEGLAGAYYAIASNYWAKNDFKHAE